MDIKFSKLGIILSGIYLLVTIIIAIKAFTCGQMYCDLIALLPVMPWNFVIEILGVFRNAGLVTWLFLASLNLVIFYFIGFGISKVINKIRSSSNIIN